MGGITLSGLYLLALIPLTPALVGTTIPSCSSCSRARCRG